jgi:hypothetical protein
MRRKILTVIFTFYACLGVYGQNIAPIDLILLLNTSASMSISYNYVSEYITGSFLSEYLRLGDTFHLIAFSDNPRLDAARRVSDVGDVETIIGRMLLQYPIENGSNLTAALNFTEQYIKSLPLRPKKIVVVSISASDTDNLVSAARQRFNSVNATLDFVQVSPGQTLTNLPLSQRGGTVSSQSPAQPGTASASGTTSASGAVSTSGAVPSSGAASVSSGTASSSGATSTSGTTSVFSSDATSVSSEINLASGTTSSSETTPASETSTPSQQHSVENLLAQESGAADTETNAPVKVEPSFPSNVGSSDAERRQTAMEAVPYDSQRSGFIKSVILVIIILLLLLFGILVFFALRRRASGTSPKTKSILSKKNDKVKKDDKDNLPSFTNHSNELAQYAAVQPKQRTTPYTNRPLRTESGKTPVIHPTGPLLLNLFVEDQSTAIGKRNIHSLKSGYSLTVGGGKSDFLIFLVSMPPNIGEIHRNGSQCTFIPRKSKYFPDLGSNELRDCINKPIRVVSDKNYEMQIRFEMYEDPLDALNRVLMSIKVPG